VESNKDNDRKIQEVTRKIRLSLPERDQGDFPEKLDIPSPPWILTMESNKENAHKILEEILERISSLPEQNRRDALKKEGFYSPRFMDELIENAPADYPPQMQALTGVGVPDIIKAEQENIEDSDGSASDTKKPAKNPKKQTLQPPKTTMEWERLIAGIYNARPETRAYNSPRLLACLKDYAREEGVEIDISTSRIRHLKIWKDNSIHRESGSTRFGYNDGNIATVNDEELEAAKERSMDFDN
jgi:cell pole-organizing protein PopZ